MLNVQSTTIMMVKVNKTEFCKHLRYKMTQICIARVLTYFNCTNMYPLGFTGLIECRLLNIFEPVQSRLCAGFMGCFTFMRTFAMKIYL